MSNIRENITLGLDKQLLKSLYKGKKQFGQMLKLTFARNIF